MKSARFALGTVALLLCAGAPAHAQQAAPHQQPMPATPPPSLDLTPQPEQNLATPVNGTKTVAQPEQPQQKPAPQRAAPAAQQPTPLVLRLTDEAPALRDGQRTTVPVVKELTIPAERAQIIRQRGIITQSLGEDLDRWINDLAQSGGARFERDESGSGWVLVEHSAYKIDPSKTRAALLEAVQDPSIKAAQAIVLSRVAPKRDLNFFISRGITAHLGTGNTNYKGSSKARMTNIHAGASKFKDRLFEGKVFSFNQFLGPINRANGFVTGLVIAGGRTVEGLGGGICQVSTTVFRSLYRAGLPIKERHPHSYQVGYYQPQGLDAAIYQPTLDLKFANDTGGAIWFQTDWDDQTGEFNVYAFGRPRNFEVRLSEPRVLSSIPSPADRTIYTSDLPTGQRKQVDWAAPGGTLAVDRKFVEGGKTVKTETLKSTYTPWPNIFLEGK